MHTIVTYYLYLHSKASDFSMEILLTKTVLLMDLDTRQIKSIFTQIVGDHLTMDIQLKVLAFLKNERCRMALLR